VEYLPVILTTGVVLVTLAILYQTANKPERSFTFDTALDTFENVISLVRVYAPAADQLVKLGELRPEERRAHVMELIRETLPDVDADMVVQVIEWWVATEKRKVGSGTER
jgi:hypothetical protein